MNIKINGKLKLAIRSKFINQEAFAKAVDEHGSYVSLVIHRNREPSKERKEKWAKVLGMTPEELF